VKSTRSVALAVLIPALLALALVVAACGGGETTTTTPALTTAAQTVTTTQPVSTTTSTTTTTTASTTIKTPTTETAAPALSQADIASLKSEVNAFGDAFFGQYGDTKVMFAFLAEDATYSDPSNSDFRSGRPAVESDMSLWFQMFPDCAAKRQAMYVSADGAAFAVAVNTIWPPNPAETWCDELMVFRFRDSRVIGWDLWERASSLKIEGYGVFGPGQDGLERLTEMADRYLKTWASGDKARIAALYHKDASFFDSVRGIQAQGAAAIAEKGAERFGTNGPVTFKVVDLYAETNGMAPPRPQAPDLGAIVALGIHYRCSLVVDGTPKTIDSLVTLDLGTRRNTGFDLDPDGLISREEVFYDADSLLASGLVQQTLECLTIPEQDRSVVRQ
jgi:ketosteroid isomerase-like protein